MFPVMPLKGQEYLQALLDRHPLFFEPSRLQGPVGSSANGPTLEAIFAQMQQQEQIQRRQEENQRRQELKIEQLTQLLQQQQQGQQQQQQPPQQQPSEVKENKASTSVI
ncbi:hypothetical protein G6F31_020899 [Rhizopus arrhizus]|nr:hypothetical protein G6F31_020899 [Rhizopus arrhizus]